MKVTDVKIYITNSKNPMASGAVVINDMIELKFSIMEGKNGLFLSWKGSEKYFDKKDQKDKWSSPISIKDESLRNEIQEKAIAAYKAKID